MSLWNGLRAWSEPLMVLAVGAVLGVIAFLALRLFTRYVVGRHSPTFAETLDRHCAGPSAWLFPLTGMYAVLLAADGANETPGFTRLVLSLVLVAVGFLLVRLVSVLEDRLLVKFKMDVADNLRARRFHTQFRILRQVLALIVWLIVGSAVLLQFEGFRQFGTGLLASAGIAGIVLGFAAQRTLGNLIAGFQIALTQPIRLDDVVVVEGEWGRIEEITLTYVIVNIWDQRRLVLPISYFIENPFTNWTRRNAEVLGTVFLHVDYSVPLDALRTKLTELVGGHPDWDGRVAEIVAFESHPTTLEIRALVSARDSGAGWRLRCDVREGLVTFLQQQYPDALPRFRVENRGKQESP